MMRVRLRVDDSEITFVKENESFGAEVREWCVGVQRTYTENVANALVSIMQSTWDRYPQSLQ